MWLASLHRLVAGNPRSRKDRRLLAARKRKSARLVLESLEDRITPSQTAGGYTALTQAIAADTAGNTNYVIQITNNFQFNSGGQVSISKLGAGSTLTIEGQNGTNYTLTGNGNRLFDIAKNQTVSLQNLTLTGGQVSGSAAKGGAVYNSGSLSMKSVVVGGNQAIGSSGNNAAGGGIYSSGGSLTLSHDVIGEKVEQTVKKNFDTKAVISKHTNIVVGASNKAAGGTGGSGLGGGLYVAGGTVNVTSCTIAGNQASGNVSAQGGGLYVSGTKLNLTKDLIGFQSKVVSDSLGSNYTFFTTSSNAGSANKAMGGVAMGGGLYVSGGSVSVSQGVIGGNQAVGGAGLSAAGGGVYSINASLTFKTAAFPGNQALGGAASAGLGNNGGNAQGGGLFISGGSATLTNCHLAHINAYYGSGGATGGNGETGGNGGSVQGGGIYVDNATLTLTGGVLTGSLTAGNGGNGTAGTWMGGAGGNAQGGVIFALNSKVTASGTSIEGTARPGNGGSGANGTSKHLTGGTGGEAGTGQGGGVYAQGGSLTLTNSTEVGGSVYHGHYGPGLYYGDILGAQGGKGGAGYNVTSGAGGAGGQGNTDAGGGVFASGAAVVMEAGANIQGGQIHAGVGGQGGKGKTGGQGGAGGMALGGGLFIQGGSVSLTGTNTGIFDNSLNSNSFYPGFPPPDNGGTGGTGGSGTLAGIAGKGGDAYGGGLYALSTSVSLNNGATIADNTAFAGDGGRGQNGITGSPTAPGGNGGNGGAAGAAIGGGAYLGGAGVSLQINAGLSNPAPVLVFANGVVGGEGGVGGHGGLGGQKLIATLSNPTTGTTGGNGGNGGNGGLAEGAGLAVQGSGNTPINLNNGEIFYNSAKGGEGGGGGLGGTGSFGSWAGGNGGSGGAAGSALGGGVYVQQGALTLTNTVMQGNTVSGGFGGIAAAGGDAFGFTSKEATVGHSGIAGNGGLGNVGGAAQGGGLYANASTVTLNTATIDGNGSYGGQGGVGGYGGVTWIYRVNAPGYDRRSSSGNSGGNGGAGQGGGVFATGASTLTALNSDISGNAADGGAGGTGGRGGYYFYSTRIHYTGGNGGVGGNAGNGAVGQGGGAYVNGGTLTLVNSTVANNKLWGGNGGAGGLGENGSDGQDYGGSGGAGGSGGNAAAASGGGVFATASTLKLVNDTVANNTINVENGEIGGAGGVGGNGGNAGVAVGFATVASRQGVGGNAGNGGNAATGQGGGLYLGSGSLSLLNATFAYNTVATAGTPGAAGTPGKGIFNSTLSPPVRLTPDGQPGSAGKTTGTDQDGGLYVGSSVTTASVENTILALNTAATDTDVSATFSSSDDDFVGDGTGSNLKNGVNGDIVGQYTNTQLTSFFGQLGSNGGPTQTIVPYATSPTIGAGDPNAASAIASAEGIGSSGTPTDQRGLPRLVNGKIDIGSTELQVDFTGSPSVSTVQSGQSGQTITYTVNLTNGEGEPINVTLTDVVPGGTTYVSNSASGSVYISGGQTPWTTITAPSATNSNTLTATATLAPGETATLTFTVTVAPTASGTITDTANLGWTGTITNTTGSLSVPMSTTVTGGVSSTSTVLTSSGNPSFYGQPVTFTATVRNGASNLPAGNVVFEDGSTILGKETLSGGEATFTTSALSVGSHNITAIYGGDTNDYGSTSNTLTQVVNQDNTTTTLASSIIPSVLGQSVTFKATVNVNSPGAGTPTGTVTFYDGSTKLGTGTLSGGVATFTTSTLPVGSNSITAVYGGDTNDQGSTSKVFTQQVDYHFGGFLPPLSNGMHYEVNRTIPIKFTLTDYNGNAITSLSAVTSIQIQALDANGNPTGPPFTPVSTNNHGWEYTGGHYQYNWQTKGLSAGSYEILVNLADGTTQTKTITLTANGNSAGLTAGTSAGTATAGALLGGEVDLYVDNSNGDLTSDELARIQDAVNAVNTTVAPYGVSIVSVTDSTLANATLSMNTTSVLGGVAQGVLGVTTNADQVTIIQGWNWYAGSDPTQIASGQYDFETTVMHELGHVLGLGHSSSSTSVMYATLATGTTTRVLTTADLNVPDSDTGPCALRAAPAAVVNDTSSAAGATVPSSTNSPSSGSPMSIADQLFADFSLLLSDLSNVYQSQLSSLSALWQQADESALQRLEALLSLEASN
jgi:uncharacterized repeat protein (TIGR01451 family)